MMKKIVPQAIHKPRAAGRAMRTVHFMSIIPKGLPKRRQVQRDLSMAAQPAPIPFGVCACSPS
jgi:hypothetical protein